jgi:hypothetical protein
MIPAFVEEPTTRVLPIAAILSQLLANNVLITHTPISINMNQTITVKFRNHCQINTEFN